MWVVFLGRLAAFPSSLTAAAAGSAGVSWRRFLIADTAGALVSLALVLGLGYGLGEAYDEGGAWVTAGGVVALVVAAVVLGRALSSSRVELRRHRHLERSRSLGDLELDRSVEGLAVDGQPQRALERSDRQRRDRPLLVDGARAQPAGEDVDDEAGAGERLGAVDDANVEQPVVELLAPQRAEARRLVPAVPDPRQPHPHAVTVDLDVQRLHLGQLPDERHEERRPLPEVGLEPLAGVDDLACSRRG